jgi:hypothetical protein
MRSPPFNTTLNPPPPGRAALAAPMRHPSRGSHICKLVLCARQDRLLMEAVGGYPGRLQSCILSAWLRGGWRLTRTRHLSEPMPPGLPVPPAPAARMTRRVRFDDPGDPALASFLCSLPRKERGREIRNFIAYALRNRPARLTEVSER